MVQIHHGPATVIAGSTAPRKSDTLPIDLFAPPPWYEVA